MKFKLAIAGVLAAALLAGCAGTAVGISSSNSPSMGGSLPPLGISRSSAGIQAEVRPNSYFGLIFLRSSDSNASTSGTAERGMPTKLRGLIYSR